MNEELEIEVDEQEEELTFEERFALQMDEDGYVTQWDTEGGFERYGRTE